MISYQTNVQGKRVEKVHAKKMQNIVDRLLHYAAAII